MKKKLLTITATLVLSACATPPATYSVSNTRTYSSSYDQVWESLVAFFASRNIQIKNIAKDSGVIYAETAKFDDSFADCGKPGILLVTGRRVNFNVFVNRSGKEPTVTVNTEFTEVRRFENNIQTASCNSKGVLEQMVLNAIAK